MKNTEERAKTAKKRAFFTSPAQEENPVSHRQVCTSFRMVATKPWSIPCCPREVRGDPARSKTLSMSGKRH